MSAQHTPGRLRVRTVEREPGFGWIARDPNTGAEIWPEFRWTSRSVARSVVHESRVLNASRAPIAKATGSKA
jgi:hypothetical protein